MGSGASMSATSTMHAQLGQSQQLKFTTNSSVSNVDNNNTHGCLRGTGSIPLEPVVCRLQCIAFCHKLSACVTNHLGCGSSVVHDD